MAIQHTITRKWSSGGGSISKDENVSGDGEQNVDVVAYANQDTVVTYVLTVAKLLSFYMVSNQNLTVVPHDSSDNPLASIQLEANIPFVWTIGSGLDNPFVSNLSKFHVTNSGSTNGLFQLRSLFDATPASPSGS